MSSVDDTSLIIEACFSCGADAALLYRDNVTAGFFDLSSGDAGAILQTLRTYGIRLAIVCAPGEVTPSRRFGEMVAEERQRRFFGLFPTRRAARAWLEQP